MADERPPAKPVAADLRWREATAGSTPAGSAKAKRRKQFTLLAGLFLALASLVVAWLFFLHRVPPEPLFLTIHIGSYNSRLYPVVPFAKQDSERLSRHFEDSRHAETKTKTLLTQELGRLASHTSKPVVIHLSALALVHEGGTGPAELVHVVVFPFAGEARFAIPHCGAGPEDEQSCEQNAEAG